MLHQIYGLHDGIIVAHGLLTTTWLTLVSEINTSLYFQGPSKKSKSKGEWFD